MSAIQQRESYYENLFNKARSSPEERWKKKNNGKKQNESVIQFDKQFIVISLTL